jgi:hypothetical protein
VYIVNACPICLRWFLQAVLWAWALARETAGSSSAAKMPMAPDPLREGLEWFAGGIGGFRAADRRGRRVLSSQKEGTPTVE